MKKYKHVRVCLYKYSTTVSFMSNDRYYVKIELLRNKAEINLRLKERNYDLEAFFLLSTSHYINVLDFYMLIYQRILKRILKRNKNNTEVNNKRK